MHRRSTDWCKLLQMANGMAVAVTGGSYHKDKAPHISGTGGWIIYYTLTECQVTGSFYEVSNDAGSYRGELLGLHMLHIFLHTIEQEYYKLGPCPVPLWCDNKSALTTVEHPCSKVSMGRKHANILRAVRAVWSKGRMDHKYLHVFAHQDDYTAWENLTMESQLNCICDSLAKSAVHMGALAVRTFPSKQSPFMLELKSKLLTLAQICVFKWGM